MQETGPDTGSGRLPMVPLEPEDPIVAEVFDLYRQRGRNISVLYRVLGNAPTVLKGWTELGWPLRHEASVSRGLRELAIMRIALLTGAAFEWQAHWGMALEAGITDAQLAALPAWRGSDRFDDDQRLVLAFTDEIIEDVEVGDETFAGMQARFTPQEIVELTVTAAFYSGVSRVLRTLRIPLIHPDDDPRMEPFRRFVNEG